MTSKQVVQYIIVCHSLDNLLGRVSGSNLASYPRPPPPPPPPKEWPDIHCLRMCVTSIQISRNLDITLFYPRIYDYVTFAYASANVSVVTKLEMKAADFKTCSDGFSQGTCRCL